MSVALNGEPFKIEGFAVVMTSETSRKEGIAVAKKNVERRAEILETARNIIADKGIQGATLRAIADEANVSTGAIYHYFSSKEEILYAVMDESLSMSSQIAIEAKEMSIPKEQIHAEISENILERFKKDQHNRIQFYLAKEAMMGDEALRQKFQLKYSQWIGRTKELIQFLYEKPETPLDDAIASVLIGAIDGIVMQLLLGANTASEEQLKQVFDHLLLTGIPRFIDQVNNAAAE